VKFGLSASQCCSDPLAVPGVRSAYPKFFWAMNCCPRQFLTLKRRRYLSDSGLPCLWRTPRRTPHFPHLPRTTAQIQVTNDSSPLHLPPNRRWPQLFPDQQGYWWYDDLSRTLETSHRKPTLSVTSDLPIRLLAPISFSLTLEPFSSTWSFLPHSIPLVSKHLYI